MTDRVQDRGVTREMMVATLTDPHWGVAMLKRAEWLQGTEQHEVAE